VTGRRRKRSKQLLDYFKEMREYSKLKEKLLDCTLENSLWSNVGTCRKTDYKRNIVNNSAERDRKREMSLI